MDQFMLAVESSSILMKDKVLEAMHAGTLLVSKIAVLVGRWK